ncbi:MAG: BadF/BadG/BcrA/BcrD ATPase family protein [Bacillota bacterium]|nr:BadF/BadG/BcrA/BcrD ATPase family protein [Bacillota bacterium]
MSIYVGIDGGGSKTSWVAVFDDGRLGGNGVLGPSNMHSVGQAGMAAVLRTIVDKVREATHVQTFDWVNICLGLSGVDRFQERTVVEGVLKELGVKRYRLETDAAIALAGATAGEPGVVVIAGTGSLAYGVGSGGKKAKSGGWGYLLGDEGSGYYIGRMAISAALKAHDWRGPKTQLTELLLKHFALERVEAMYQLTYHRGLTRVEVAAVTRVVVQAALEGDVVSQLILDEAGNELAVSAAAVRAQLGLKSTDPGIVATVGGVFEKSSRVREAFISRLTDRCPGAKVIWPEFQPAVGAISLAMELKGAAFRAFAEKSGLNKLNLAARV